MKSRSAPRFETRRADRFAVELEERARSWIPDWGLADGDPDFGRALLRVAARYSSEVAERLDNVGDKMMRGLFDWLGVRGKAARAARLPVVFKLADAAQDAKDGLAPVSLQVGVGSSTVMLETESDVRIVPGRLASIVAVAPELDAYYKPPPGLDDLSPATPSPTEWRLKTSASPGSETLQLDPGLGLAAGMLLDVAGAQYRVPADPNGDLVKIDPPLEGDALAAGAVVSKVTTFVPFEAARNVQQHIVYLGDPDLFNLDASAVIEVVGGERLGDGVVWEYFGKVKPPEGSLPPPDDVSRWQALTADTSKSPDAVVLSKPAGAVDPLKIGVVEARWIRARTSHLDGTTPVLSTDALTVRLNAIPPDPPPSPAPPVDPRPAGALPPVDVMVNATPATAQNFYPLGRDPRLFDALYVGCPEAFSKPAATARIRFEVGEPVFTAMSMIVASLLGTVVAAVDKGGNLHLLQPQSGGELKPLSDDGPVRPPQGTKLTSQGARPAMWLEAQTLCVAVVADKDVWVWKQSLTNVKVGSWQALGAPLPVTNEGAPTSSVVAAIDNVTGALTRLALRDGIVFWRGGMDTAWHKYDKTTDRVKEIAPIVDAATGAPGVGFLAVMSSNELRRTDSTAAALTVVPIGGTNTVSAAVQPRGFAWPAVPALHVAALSTDSKKILAWSSQTNASTSIDIEPTSMPRRVPSLDARYVGHVPPGEFHVCLLADEHDGPVLLEWTPFVAPAAATAGLLFLTRAPVGMGPFNGPPLFAQGRLYVPGTSRGVVLAAQLVDARIRRNAGVVAFVSALAMQRTGSLANGDTVAVGTSTAHVASARFPAGRDLFADRQFALLDKTVDAAATAWTFPTSTASPFRGKVEIPPPAVGKNFRIEPGGQVPRPNDFIFISDGAAGGDVAQVLTVAGNLITVDKASAPTAVSVEYWIGTSVDVAVLPALSVLGDNVDARAVDNGDVYVGDAAGTVDPVRQVVAAVAIDSATPAKIEWMVLASPWNTPPGPGATYVVDDLIRQWAFALSDASSNPQLSWEYWDGSSWSSLKLTSDSTSNLRNSGSVAFDVPNDLTETDWAGTKSHWVRARLIGGDYGTEVVTIVTQPASDPSLPAGSTEQTVTRKKSGAQPPYVVDMWVVYSLGTAAYPAFLQTEDSGTLRNQSDANRSTGLLVELFTPLAATLQRFGQERAATAGSTPACPQPCDCAAPATPPPLPVRPIVCPTDPEPAPPALPDRALFLGFSAPPSGSPVNVLMLVDQERKFDTLAPVRIDAFTGDGFTSVTVNDATRALGESGVLGMSFSIDPVPAALFGESLSWVRITPSRADPNTPWSPGLRGVYLNAVWASARETLTRELLGSSTGGPDQVFTLGRPPLLDGSLELRVCEPLGQEEITALTETDDTRVQSEVLNLPGHWVRWTQVVDPHDENPTARVYALDEDSGTVRFGDGKRGMIPPAGRDGIVAFRYQRTEAGAATDVDVPGNLIAPRTVLNLVSPVESVESVVAADQSAGGAPPEPAERVLRFGGARLRHRDRAIAAEDFEALVLESSPRFVQARAFVSPGNVRIVVVVRGAEPRPTAAQGRELVALLRDATVPLLGGPDGLTIAGPGLRTLRVDLTLRVAGLDKVGALGKRVDDRIVALFDTATGGIDDTGWPLGATPRTDDIALALAGDPDIESLASVSFVEQLDDGTERSFEGPVKPDELVRLAKEKTRITFAIVEVVA